ncbi:NAD(P)-binding protein [Punctularia strigosozonata HHB-11173 SS5]|uniref:3-oxoacyl-[acyl-carrier-protein] reductase n=1 Tax=Punctularia strigosozonata (strain HHB-11173) TaxID=741275 RepID=R7S2G5_PUNST|nr:NAD(P)-binding protein [Punctularia strigosozonata HHB-11173 SS5]EIN04398.1 NAD(P)-binding protein [Punctularia strigosozonata HHB-11173 SS5]
MPSGGIGKATALALAKRGCSIAVHYHRNAEEATKLVAALGVKAAAFQADLSSYDEARWLHAEVVRELGHPDILYNNSGMTGTRIGPRGDIGDMSVDEFERTWRTNTGTAYLLTQLCIPHMEEQKWGRIIFCSSVAAGTGGVIGPHYASSKSAMHGLVHWIAQRYAKDGIASTCNAVAPALIVGTTMMANPPDEHKRLIPVGRFGQPEEIASIVELLVLNAYMTNKRTPSGSTESVPQIVVGDGGMQPTAF